MPFSRGKGKSRKRRAKSLPGSRHQSYSCCLRATSLPPRRRLLQYFARSGIRYRPGISFFLSFYSLLYYPYRSIRLDCSCGSHASYPFSWKKPRKSKRRTVIPLSGTPYAALIQAAYALFHRLSVFLLHPFSPPSSFRAKRKRKAKESLQTMGKGKKKKTNGKTLHTPPRFSPGKSNCALSFLSRSIPPLFPPAIFFSSLCSAPESPSSSPSPAALRSGHFLSVFSSLWTH